MMRRRRRQRSGFALLFVFMMAAAIAVTLYREMPRIVFQGQREKEQLLIDRGEQYKRAIQLFVRKNKKYPGSMDEVEKLMDVRFLRKRYKDPLSGKDDWRIIHVDAAGVLTDSLVQKRKDPFGKEGDKDKEKEKEKELAAAAFDPNNPGGMPGQPGEMAAGLARRASDRPAAVAGQQGQVTQYDPSRPYDPNQPYPPPQDGAYAGQGQPLPGQAYPGQGIEGQPGQPFPPQPYQQPYQQPYPQQSMPQPSISQQPFPQQPFQQQPFPQQGQPYPGAYPAQPGGFPQGQPSPFPVQGGFTAGIPGLPGQQTPFNPMGQIPPYPTGVISSQTGGVAATPFPGFQPRPGGTPGMGAPGGSQAVDLIRQLLTTPRPGGLPGAGAAQAGGMGAGIAGIASKVDGKGIKVYAEREKIKEWEFIYDFKQDKSGAAATGQAGNLAGMGGQPSGSQPSSSPFGIPAGPMGQPQGAAPGSSPSRTR